MQALLEYAQAHIPGFERACFVDFAPRTGVRQTRLLEGEYVVTKRDVTDRVHFHDSIRRGRDYYTPHRAQPPVGVEQLLVAGRHYSATPQARKISREIPPCMAMGEAAGIAAAQALDSGILLAMLQREKTGEGQRIAVSLYNSMPAMQMQEAAVWMMRGRELNWAAMPLSGVFETLDGAVVMVGAFKEHPLRDICTALGIEDLSADPGYATLEQQKAHRSELQTVFRDRFATGATAHWLERLGGIDILCAPVMTLADALDDPQTTCNGMIVEIEPTAAGPMRLVASPIDMSAAPFAVRRAPPALGEHNEEALAPARRRGRRMSIDFVVSDGIARVTLNRAERMNAIDSATEAALGEVWSAIDLDPTIRCAVLAGAGRAFCAGADMKEDGPGGLAYWARTGDHGFGGIALSRRPSVPVIARVNDVALGGGFEMVLGCDPVVAADTASFGLPEPRVGRLPLDGMITLPRRRFTRSSRSRSSPQPMRASCFRSSTARSGRNGAATPPSSASRRRPRRTTAACTCTCRSRSVGASGWLRPTRRALSASSTISACYRPGRQAVRPLPAAGRRARLLCRRTPPLRQSRPMRRHRLEHPAHTRCPIELETVGERAAPVVLEPAAMSVFAAGGRVGPQVRERRFSGGLRGSGKPSRILSTSSSRTAR